MVPHKLVRIDSKALESHHDGVAGEHAPGPVARLFASLRAGSLDQALLAGADPGESSELTARAGTLTSQRFRESIADGLDRWIAAARRPRSRRRVLPPAALAAENAAEVREIVTLLRGDGPIYAGGVAAVARLFTDGVGPAYLGDSETLSCQLHEARAALAGELPPTGRSSLRLGVVDSAEVWE